MKEVFRFKKFEIDQTNAPFKIGTDGLLLATWAQHTAPKHILDIGCGTGLMALILAQRFTSASIKGIDINNKAYEISKSNFRGSPFSSRLKAIHSPLRQFEPAEKFDLIVCNPPFFKSSTLSGNKDKDTARHAVNMTLAELFSKAALLLNSIGVFALVVPYYDLKSIESLAEQHKLSLLRSCAVQPTPQHQPKRLLLEYSPSAKKPEHSKLVIEAFGRHGYSKEYLLLTKDFLLDK